MLVEHAAREVYVLYRCGAGNGKGRARRRRRTGSRRIYYTIYTGRHGVESVEGFPCRSQYTTAHIPMGSHAYI